MEEIQKISNSQPTETQKRRVGRPRKNPHSAVTKDSPVHHPDDLLKDLEKIGRQIKSQIHLIESDLNAVRHEQEEFKTYIAKVEHYTKECERYQKSLARKLEVLEKKTESNRNQTLIYTRI